jgi:DNA-directed RNA polymerase specialized sigma24 family protein
MHARPDVPGSSGRFLTTRWSVVLAAGQATSPRSREALESLCSSAWYPLYAFARRKGTDAESAADLVQGFVASLLARDDLATLSPERGRFRSFLLASFTHFIANERDRERALRRGGGVAPIAIDAAGADTRYRNEPSHDLTPERAFERSWALEIIARTFDALSAEYAADGKSALFEALKPELQGASESSYADVAARLGTTEGAIKTAASRLRKRWRELLRAEIAGTLSDPTDVDDELRGLFTALSS